VEKTITFSPFTRVEGDLKIELQVGNGRVSKALTCGTLYRGFEDILRGRSPLDAIVITCRICGQCGASHSAAASAALGKVFGTVPPPNGVLCANIIQAVEMVLNHLTHFYLSFAVDIAGPPYDVSLTNRFASIKGISFRSTISARSRLLALLGIFAGKWPNTLAIQPGGVTKPISAAELAKADSILAEFIRFLEEQVFGCNLADWLSLKSLSDVEAWLSDNKHANSDIGVFIHTSLKHGFLNLGRGPGRFLSGGELSSHNGGAPFFNSGYYDGSLHLLNETQITEHITYSWYESDSNEIPSLQKSRVYVKPSKEVAYSWCKAPRYAGKSAEVGPIARMVINGDHLALDLVKIAGSNVFSRVLTRLHEMVKLTVQIREWLYSIEPDKPFYVREEVSDGSAFAFVPAPRGMLGHWVDIENGRINHYEIITPTCWNFSPRDSSGQPGPAEEALVGTEVDEGTHYKSIAHIVRSFDPCLFCSVHLLDHTIKLL